MFALVPSMRGFTSLEQAGWGTFVDTLKSNGWRIGGNLGMLERVEAFVALGYFPRELEKVKELGVPQARRILVLLEPSVSSPTLHSRAYFGQFGAVFAASPIWSQTVGAEPFLWPQNLRREPVPNLELAEATLLNSEKRSASAGSLYGLRRSVIRTAGRSGRRVMVAGSGWNSGPIRMIGRLKEAASASIKSISAGHRPDYLEAWGGIGLSPTLCVGPVTTKAMALQYAPVSIVIENSADYVSEKLVDVVRHGVAPIYVGPDLSKFGLPDSIAIRAEPSAQSILTTLERLSGSEVEDVIAAGRYWIDSKDAELHESALIQRSLAIRIVEASNRVDS